VLPHDRQFAGIVGYHWLGAPWPYHTGGTRGTGKLRCLPPPVLQNNQGKAPGNLILPGSEQPRPTPELPFRRRGSSDRASYLTPPPQSLTCALRPPKHLSMSVNYISLLPACQHRQIVQHLQATATSGGFFSPAVLTPLLSASCFDAVNNHQTLLAENCIHMWTPSIVTAPQRRSLLPLLS
jgi:hypothetical protein